MKRLVFVACLLMVLSFSGMAQNNSVFIRLTDPIKENNSSSSSRRFIVGSTCKACSLSMNGDPVYVYATGTFAIELNLQPGENRFELKATNSQGKVAAKKITFNYQLPVPEKSVTEKIIQSVVVYPQGDLVLAPGECVQLRVKALPGCMISVLGQPLHEIPDSLTNGIRGIYQGTYCIQPSDTFQALHLPVRMQTADSSVITKTTENSLSVWRSGFPHVGITRGRLAHLEYGLGDDRLGGAKIGYLDSLVRLRLTGRVGDDWRVQLSPGRTAYIPSEHVNLLPDGVFAPASLTNKIVAYGDSLYDYVEIPLSVRLPYQSMQQTNPSRIVLDIFGATNNTNWISQLNSLKEITQIDYEQVADEQFRITLQLKHAQHWGHRLYYKGNTLVWQIKQQPADLSLNKRIIAVDAGHGGTNLGAVGPTGVIEKDLSLAVSLKLRDLLEAAGAKVIMTREKELFFDNKERILFYRDSTPDLLVSIHLNSSADPIRVGGTSTYYRSVGFRPLSQAIYQRMLSLGLKEYGNNGSFNFMLNSPTEYPNALVEMLFLSNPAEEMKILDPGFQQQIAEQVLNGIRDFLQQAATK